MLNRDKTEAQDRIIYILSSRGSDGFKRLSQIYDPGLNVGANCSGGFKKNTSQRDVYDRLAEGLNSEGSDAWQPPFEVYPDTYWDASYQSYSSRESLERAGEIPALNVNSALRELNHYRFNTNSNAEAYVDFQQRLNEKLTGKLTAEQRVRAIQIAAVENHIVSQKVLGTMYANGSGVERNHHRAAYWFERAAYQGDKEAEDNLATVEQWIAESAQNGPAPVSVEDLRRAAWLGDDLLAQVALGDLYSGQDGIEAFVWYYLATINPSGLERGIDIPQADRDDAVGRAKDGVNELLDSLLNSEINDAHLRVIQVLSTRGAEGYIRLGEIYDMRPDTEVVEQIGSQATPGGTQPTFGEDRTGFGFETNNLEAFVYYLKADQYGHTVASLLKGSLMQSTDQSWPNQASSVEVEEIAKDGVAAWQPPYELYPNNYWDASLESFAARDALDRLLDLRLTDKGIPYRDLQYALKALGYYNGPFDGNESSATGAVKNFQKDGLNLVERKQTGTLKPWEMVQLVQYAATKIKAEDFDQRRAILRSQNTLGTMYFKGIGVIESGPRAVYWFERAAVRNDPRALRNLAEVFQYGAAGLEIDLDRASNFRVRACRAGYDGIDLNC